MKMSSKFAHSRIVQIGLIVLSALLIVLLVSPLFTQVSATGYENDFDKETTETFLENWTVAVGNGSVAVQDGKLILSTSGNKPTAVIYNNSLGISNYTAEFDFSFDSCESNTRWGGFVLGYKDGEGFWHASLRKNGNVNIDYYDYASNSYPVINSFTRAEGEVNNSVKVKIVFVDNVAAYYVNGIYVAHIDISSSEAGKIGFACSGSVVVIDNLKITAADQNDLPVFRSTDVYVPKTGYVNAPVVVAAPSSLAGATYDLNGERPAIAMLTVDADLNAVSGGVSYGKADDLVNQWQAGVIPAFHVTDEASANAAAKFFAQGNFADSFIAVDSEDADLLKQARSVAIYSRGVIDFSDKTNITVAEIAKTVYENGASVAIVPADYSAEDINHLRARLVTVWKYAADTSYLSALYSGVNGIITTDYSELFDIYETQKNTVVTKKTLVSGHRGLASYPENTINGFLKAYEAGADMFELDLYVSSDGYIVVHHDSTVDRTTNGTGKIEQMTLEQIKALTIDTHGVSETVPTLAEVYEAFKGKDVVLQIELKSSREDLVPKLAELTAQYDMFEQVVVFSSNFTQMKRVRDYMPQAPAAVFVGSGYGYGSDYEQLQIQTAKYNFQNSKDYLNLMNFEYAYNLAARGMTSFVHTIGSRSIFDDLILSVGADCILTDYPEWGSDTSIVYELTPIIETTELGTYFTPKCKVNGTYTVVSCGMERTDGIAVETDGNGAYCLSEKAEVVFYYDFSGVITSGGQKQLVQYRIYSGPVVIE
ncbi:MAG: hypothetical protein IKW10_02380 [Oscillospiraceae bacterium]|nr:hypothetical protein [Oscillospiraceae bacterium]